MAGKPTLFKLTGKSMRQSKRQRAQMALKAKRRRKAKREHEPTKRFKMKL